MGSPRETISNSKVTGHVYSGRGSMLGSAKVTCNGKKTITLFDGKHELKNIEPGTYKIYASLKGFKSDSQTVIIQKDDIISLDFQLSEAIWTAKIYDTVYDAETRF
jgi:hypothetical protein